MEHNLEMEQPNEEGKRPTNVKKMTLTVCK